ncbi:hypothetical protein [Segetibacter aerophilus]|uniref:Uncharacterized protein n=1 Tax=Segetibacter aerophilus TaxID=670293 RepID=A0A512BE55_9BACT|nr:hypothetical protein [Segetibacter aerophilus]GEO10243.1 hypothetical protein SAE01_27390 [Segetibacter aerophilus]
MNNNDTNTDLLIRYLDGELEGTDLVDLEAKVSKDPSLKQELENLRNTQVAVRSYALRQQVGNIHNEMMKEFAGGDKRSAPVVSMLRKAFSIAAIFIVVVGGFFTYQYSSLSSGKLFESNYQEYSLREVRGETKASNLEQLYKQHLNQQIIDTFLTIRQPSLTDYFYAGNAYLAQRNAPAAIQSFTLLQQKNFQAGSHILEDDSEYYLAMAYLQNNQAAKALPILTKIHDDKQHLYHDKVSALFLFKVKLLSRK